MIGLLNGPITTWQVNFHSHAPQSMKEEANFTVICLVTWPLNESEVGVDLVMIQTSLLFLC